MSEGQKKDTREKDKRGRLKEMMFDFQAAKDGKVFISWMGKVVKILKGQEAQRFLKRLETLSDYDKQLAMAKVTGNFKRGNEKLYKR